MGRTEERKIELSEEDKSFVPGSGSSETLPNPGEFTAAAPTFPGRPKVTVGGSAYLRTGSWKLGHES